MDWFLAFAFVISRCLKNSSPGAHLPPYNSSMRTFTLLASLLWTTSLSPCASHAAFYQPATAQTPPSQSASTSSPDLSGISEVVAPGTPGALTVWGPHATVLVAGEDRALFLPVAVSAQAHDEKGLPTGRIVAFAHTGYLDASSKAIADTALFLDRCLSWAVPTNTPKRIACFNSDLANHLISKGHAATTLKGKNWHKSLKRADFDALFFVGNNLSPEQVDAMAAFSASGGALLLAQTAWAWNANARDGILSNPLNRLCTKTRAGIAWTQATTEKTGTTGFLVPPPSKDPAPLLLTAQPALEALIAANAASTAQKPSFAIKQASATLVAAARHLPTDDLLLRPRLESLLMQHAKDLVPTAKTPLNESRPLARALLAFQVAYLDSLPVEKITPHPAAAAFPGEVPSRDLAPRTTPARTVTVQLDTPKWHSTGLYAPPGEVILIKAMTPLPSGKSPLQVRIGCHKDQLWHHSKWERVPEITHTWPLTDQNTRIASPYGGLVYIDVPERAGGVGGVGGVEDPSLSTNALTFSIAGAVEAPLFVLGKTSPEAWRTTLRNAPAPWAELATDKVILSVPSSAIRTLDDPTVLMQHWDRILDAAADLATIPHTRKRPERYVPDQQISAGYMHSGYPIMTHMDAVEDMVDPEKLGLTHKRASWGLFHELGHNHQVSDWTFDGTGEVTVNLFTLYIMETVCGQPISAGHDALGKRALMVAKFQDDRKGGPSHDRWKSEPFLALIMYQQLREAFGWEVYKQVFAEYRDLKADQRPKSQQDKRDEWMIRFSKACGHNLGPFFEAWKVPTTQAARDGLKDLPVWLPKDWPGPLNAAADQPASTEPK